MIYGAELDQKHLKTIFLPKCYFALHLRHGIEKKTKVILNYNAIYKVPR